MSQFAYLFCQLSP